MRKLRVTHVTPLYFGEESRIGGGERYVSTLCRALNRHLEDRIFADIVSFSHSGRGPLDHDGLRITLVKNESMSSDPMDAVSRGLFDAIAAADVVHLHQPLTRCGEIALVAARHLGKAVVATDNGHYSSDLLLQWKGVNLIDSFVCVSEFSAQFFRPLATCPAEVVSGPVDVTFFRPDPTSSRKEGRILCVSRLVPHKGIDRVIRALPEGLELLVCGRPSDARYEALLKSLARGKNIRFCMNASDSQLLKLYRSAQVTVLASTHRDCFGNSMARPELMGFVLLESMACGTPVICSRVGGMPELVVEHETGRVFDNDDQLRNYLDDVRRGVWPQDAASEACVRHVRSRFATGVVASRLWEIYQQVWRRSSTVGNRT